MQHATSPNERIKRASASAASQLASSDSVTVCPVEPVEAASDETNFIIDGFHTTRKAMTRHGELYLRDQTPARSLYFDRGRFGRLFPWLPPFARDSEDVRRALLELGGPGGPMDPRDPLDPVDPVPGSDANEDNMRNGEVVLTAGNTFLGQFIDHDLTFDPTSSLERQADPESIANFRTPAFELDSVYGSGRAVTPHLYERGSRRGRLLVESNGDAFDVPRNEQRVALLGDPRNDENLIVSQIHVAFLRFHNAIVDLQPNESDAFDEAQRLVRWHYQWIVLHDYLARIVGEDLVHDLLKRGRRFFNWRHEPFIPVEFSVAAFRFGHSQVRPGYIAHHGRGAALSEFRAPIFDARLPDSDDPNDLRGNTRAPRRFVDFDTFFDFGNDKLRPNKKIDTKLSTALFILPFNRPGLPVSGAASLAQRNLLRHLTFGLPSGQAVAKAMGIKPLTPDQLPELRDVRLQHRTPLWYYILREAELEGGHRLAGVGARIVAEVIIGLLEGDRHSFVTQEPHWKPEYASNGTFRMTELIRMAGMTPPTASSPRPVPEQHSVDLSPQPEDSAEGRRGLRSA
jgi:hypothetical protein